MARDRFSDAADDDFNEPTYGDPAPPVYQSAARRKLVLPGTLLALIGLVSLVLMIGGMAYAMLNPEEYLNFIFDKVSIPLIEMQEPSEARDKQLEDLKAQREQALAEIRAQQGVDPVSLILNGLMLIPSALIFVGGLKMRSAGSYGLALLGSIAALVPCLNAFVCLAIPFGLWGLIVLLDPNVRDVFRTRPIAGDYP